MFDKYLFFLLNRKKLLITKLINFISKVILTLCKVSNKCLTKLKIIGLHKDRKLIGKMFMLVLKTYQV